MKCDYLSDPKRFTIRGKLGHISALLGNGPIDDPDESSSRVGFADSYARDALDVAWLAVNDLQMAIEDLNRKKAESRSFGDGETISFDDLRMAESLIFSAICRIGRMGDEGER
jgi:hypothetical protein